MISVNNFEGNPPPPAFRFHGNCDHLVFYSTCQGTDVVKKTSIHNVLRNILVYGARILVNYDTQQN